MGTAPRVLSKQRCLVASATAFTLVGLAGCGDQGVFHGAGRQGRETRDLGVLLFVIAGAVFVLVLTILVLAVVRSRRVGERDEKGDEKGNKKGDDVSLGQMTIFGGIVLPVVVLVSVFLVALPQMSDHSRSDADLIVRVTGHQWWWEVDYPDFATANEIHVPVGRRVRIELTSEDVVHSFWVPSLRGKRDAIPGTTTNLVIEAEQEGTFTGSCAEFCGVQHTNMGLTVVVESPEGYERWYQKQQRVAPIPTGGSELEGQQVFLGSACVYCHQVRGTSALSDHAPDLTHIASRTHLGGGVLENNRGNLAGWVLDAQHAKPGSAMPSFTFDGDDLTALLAYLESLD